MPEDASQLIKIFADAGNRPEIVSARFGVIDQAFTSLSHLANLIHGLGWISKNETALAITLMTHMASDLIGSMALNLRNDHPYSAAALLRQFIEIEYLMFLGYQDNDRFADWYRASPDEIRKQFNPQRMRDASGGLFQDREY